MSFLAFRRRLLVLLVLLVPIINFIFLFLFVFSPESLPRLPKRFSLVPHVFRTRIHEDPELLEHSYLGSQQQRQHQTPLAVSESHQESVGGETSSSGSSGSNGFNYLLEQRQLLENVQLEPLPRLMIASYRPGYSASDSQPNDNNSDLDREKEEKTNRDPSTKFLTFLPHSGFHNQRSELENALLLARLLNRTLIMPKVYLGPPMPWLTFPQLHSRLLYQTKIGLEHCRAIIENPEYENQDSTSKNKKGKQTKKSPKKSTSNSPGEQQHPPPPLFPSPSPSPPQYQQQQIQEPPPDSLQQQQHVTTEEQKKLARLTETSSREQPPLLSKPVEVTIESESQPGFLQGSIDRQDQESLRPTELYKGETEVASDTIISIEDSVDKEIPTNDDTGIDEDNGNEDDTSSDEEPPSWIEEFEDDDQTQTSIATGDNIEDIMDIDADYADEETTDQDVENWNQVREGEDTEIDGDDEDEEGEEDFNEIQVGIVDEEEGDYHDGDLDDRNSRPFQRGWNSGDYRMSQDRHQGQRSRHHHHHRNRASGRFLSQRTESEASLPLYSHLDPIKPQEDTLRIRKRSLNVDQTLKTVKTPAMGSASSAERTIASSSDHQENAPERVLIQNTGASSSTQSSAKPRRGTLNPLPAECLQYESWTMVDWDVFFDLNPLRDYVRILTRESMSMDYLEKRFYLKAREEDVSGSSVPGPSNATSTGTSQDNEGGEEPEVETSEDDGNDHEQEQEQDQDESDGSADGTQKKAPPPLLRTVGDVLFFEDTNLYDYRFTENPEAPESIRTRSKYGQEFTIDWLRQRPERLIHLGSIFGTGRVSIDSLQSKAWHMMIRDHLILGTEILQTTSQRIVDKISGTVHERDEKGTIHLGKDYQDGLSHYSAQEPLPAILDPLEPGFVGIHIRMSDGHFSLSARDTIENIRQELMWQVGIQDPTQDDPTTQGQDSLQPPLTDRTSRGRSSASKKPHLSIEQCRARAQNHRQSLQTQLQREYAQSQRQSSHAQDAPLQQNMKPGQQHAFDAFSSHEERAGDSLRRSNGRYTPIYLATDAHHPRANPIFDRLFDTFECIFTLEDFEEDLEGLYRYRNPEDGARMAKFLIPMVDAMVVAKAAAFFGTPASTFSNYIQKQLRPAYTALYD